MTASLVPEVLVVAGRYAGMTGAAFPADRPGWVEVILGPRFGFVTIPVEHVEAVR